MNIQNSKKLNFLTHILPEGLLADAKWLEQHGYYRSLRSQYVASGWLEQPARGVFRRPRGTVTWEQVVISLQTLIEFPVSVGGRTALDLQGYAHYLPFNSTAVHLYGDQKLPGWVSNIPLAQPFVFRNRLRLLPKVTSSSGELSISKPSNVDNKTLAEWGLCITPWGQWGWPLVMSAPERAFLELLDELPQHESFHLADVTMEALVNLRPRVLQTLLEQTKSVKVKRLFFFFAERHTHAWLKYINRDKIDLGKGKRMLIKGGKLDPTYQITLPEELFKEEQNGI